MGEWVIKPLQCEKGKDKLQDLHPSVASIKSPVSTTHFSTPTKIMLGAPHSKIRVQLLESIP